MQVETLSTPFVKALATNATDSSFAAKPATETEPGLTVGLGVFNLGSGGATARNAAMVLPYAIGSNNVTFNIRVIGWHSIPNPANGRKLWKCLTLVEALCTASADVGIAGSYVLDTERFADTIAMVTNKGTANVSNEILSPQDDTAGHIIVDLKGCEKIEIMFNTNSSATSMNALLAFL